MSDWRLSVKGFDDLQNIYSYGERNWGPRRAERYIAELHRLFDHLASNPGLGRDRPELVEAMRAFPHASHMVFFVPLDDMIMIARVLHGAMDHAKALRGYDPISDLPD